MKILFVMRHSGYIRHYERVVRELGARGHQVHLACIDLHRKDGLGLEEMRALEADFPRITHGEVPERTDFWARMIRHARVLRSYLRYLQPRYAQAHLLRERAQKPAGTLATWLLSQLGLGRVSAFRWLLDRGLRMVEHAVPPCPDATRTILAENVELVLVTPMVDISSREIDYVKAARQLGLPTGVCVASWDNLTNKGLIQIQPDRVIVWNSFQKQEAVDLHEVAESAVIVTGAQTFDHWFNALPTLSREDFCTQAGLDSGRPILTYLGSSTFISGNEELFVQEWLRGLRSSGDPLLETCSVVIRPHPLNAGGFAEIDLNDPLAVVFPNGPVDYISPQGKSTYLDTMYHSQGVVGVNTSGFIEAAVLGRMCHALLTPEHAGTQGGTLHFNHLLRDGFLRTAGSVAEHHRQLGETLRMTLAQQWRHTRPFVESFVRPHGIDTPCVPLVANAIESCGACQPAVLPVGALHSLAIMAFWPVAATLAFAANATVGLRKRGSRLIGRGAKRLKTKQEQDERQSKLARKALTRRLLPGQAFQAARHARELEARDKR